MTVRQMAGRCWRLEPATRAGDEGERHFTSGPDALAALAAVTDGVIGVAGAYTLPSLSDLRSYLRFKGWRELPPGPAGSLWVSGEARIGVPGDEDAGLVQGAVERLAAAEGRAAKDVADSARYLLADGVPDPELAAVQLPVPCWAAECDGYCGEDFQDDEYGWVLHASSRAELGRWLADAGWVLAGDGRDFCPDDAPDDGGGLAAEIDGQQALPGVA